jgi:hypothetical protein
LPCRLEKTGASGYLDALPGRLEADPDCHASRIACRGI